MKDLLPVIFFIIVFVIPKMATMFKQTSKPKQSSNRDQTPAEEPTSGDDGGYEERTRRIQEEIRRNPGDDGGYEERTRRIQEEIRRKIAERRGATSPPTTQPPPLPESRRSPVLERDPFPQIDPFGGALARPKRAPEPQPAPPVLVQPDMEPAQTTMDTTGQQDILAQLEVLKAARATAQAAGDSHATVAGWAAATRTESGVSAWRKDLRSPADLRRAIALREVLGPPVALR